MTLRYFNVVGSSFPDVWDVSPYNLFPAVMRALVAGETPGCPARTTRPRTGRASATTSTSVTSPRPRRGGRGAGEARELLPAYNLGSGDGLSVLEIMDSFRRVTGIEFTPERHERRPATPRASSPRVRPRP